MEAEAAGCLARSRKVLDLLVGGEGVRYAS